MTGIDDQVAAFAAQLDGAAFVEMGQVTRDVSTLTTDMLNAPTHDLAAVAVREWFDLHTGDREYARTIATSAAAALGAHVALSPPAQLTGDTGLLRRVLRVAYALTPYTGEA